MHVSTNRFMCTHLVELVSANCYTTSTELQLQNIKLCKSAYKMQAATLQVAAVAVASIVHSKGIYFQASKFLMRYAWFECIVVVDVMRL